MRLKLSISFKTTLQIALTNKFSNLFPKMIKVYDQLPSSAISEIKINTDLNTVEVTYRPGRSYTYSTEDALSVNQQFLAEFETDDFSVGRFINESVRGGQLTLLTD
jgi:hypothetical protein